VVRLYIGILKPLKTSNKLILNFIKCPFADAYSIVFLLYSFAEGEMCWMSVMR